MPAATTKSATSAKPSFAALLRWDRSASYAVYRAYAARFPRLPLLWLELSGHGVPWVVLPLALLLLLPKRVPPSAASLLNLLTLTAVDLLTVSVIKPLVRRARPAYNSGIGHATVHAVDQFSFPSGHATRAALVAAVFASTPYALPVTIWAAAVCASRVALGRHHVLDVVAGAVIGAAYSPLCAPLMWSDPSADHARAIFRASLGLSHPVHQH